MGGLIAYVLSVILIVSGIVLQAFLYKPHQIQGAMLAVYVLIWGISALCIAVLVERMTLGGCSKYRIACEKKEIITDNFEDIENPTKEVEYQYKKDIKRIDANIRTSAGLIVLGAALSIFCEYLIIQYLFVGWNDIPVYGSLSIPIAHIGGLFLSGLVSYTLISSELQKSQEKDAIHESITADSFLPIAARANVTDRVHMQMLAKSTVKVDEITNTDTIDSAFEHAVKTDIDHLLDGKGTIILRIDNEKRQKELQIEADRQRTRHQLRLLKGGDSNPESETQQNTDSFYTTQLPTTGPIAKIAGTRKMRGDGLENMKRVYALYKQMGEEYFTPERKTALAEELGIDMRSINRILQKIREGEVVSQ
jgi:hypothetical protein